MRYYCNICKETITKREFEYSRDEFGKALCRYHQGTVPKKMARSNSKVTPQAQKLSEALRKRHIAHKLEAFDGHKHVDISIGWAKLNIEIDGKQHILNAKQVYSDLERDSFSHEDGIVTKRFTNEDIDKYVDQIAEAIAKVARKRYKEESESFF
jgi:very-short-patch-repair endonuclease